jgi:hypothetical protein
MAILQNRASRHLTGSEFLFFNFIYKIIGILRCYSGYRTPQIKKYDKSDKKTIKGA